MPSHPSFHPGGFFAASRLCAGRCQSNPQCGRTASEPNAPRAIAPLSLPCPRSFAWIAVRGRWGVNQQKRAFQVLRWLVSGRRCVGRFPLWGLLGTACVLGTPLVPSSRHSTRCMCCGSDTQQRALSSWQQQGDPPGEPQRSWVDSETILLRFWDILHRFWRFHWNRAGW